MSTAIIIDDQRLIVNGRVVSKTNGEGIAGLSVFAYDRDMLSKDDFLAAINTDSEGYFTIVAHADSYQDKGLDKYPDLTFKIFQGEQLVGEEILRTRVADDQELIVLSIDMAPTNSHQAVHREGATRLLWKRVANAGPAHGTMEVDRQTGISLTEAMQMAHRYPEVSHFFHLTEAQDDMEAGTVIFYAGEPQLGDSKGADAYEKQMVSWQKVDSSLSGTSDTEVSHVHESRTPSLDEALELAFAREDVHFIHIHGEQSRFFADNPAGQLDEGTVYRRHVERFW